MRAFAYTARFGGVEALVIDDKCGVRAVEALEELDVASNELLHRTQIASVFIRLDFHDLRFLADADIPDSHDSLPFLRLIHRICLC